VNLYGIYSHNGWQAAGGSASASMRKEADGVKIWKVPTSQTSPEGVDYSLSLISPEGDRIMGYDNHWPKGHHVTC
jgi:hypothetical protein